MGGNALKDYGVERLSKTEFYALQKWIDAEITESCLFPKDSYYFIRSYAEKSDFGDMDILISKREDGSGSLALESFLDGATFKKNGCCYSVLYEYKDKKFQVDFILEKEKNFEFAKHYFDYNDLGNLIGRVAHKAGFKFGHDGLWYCIREGNYKVGDICLTKDFSTALRFLGFDVGSYQYGFNSLEDIFEFVTLNPYFDPASYDLNNRSRYARIRDKKRPTYQKFLKWVEYKKLQAKPSLDKSSWLEKADNWFLDFKSERSALLAKLERKREIKSKFNGDIIKAITSLEGKDLGRFISEFKQRSDFETWVLASTKNEVAKEIEFQFNKQQIIGEL